MSKDDCKSIILSVFPLMGGTFADIYASKTQTGFTVKDIDFNNESIRCIADFLSELSLSIGKYDYIVIPHLQEVRQAVKEFLDSAGSYYDNKLEVKGYFNIFPQRSLDSRMYQEILLGRGVCIGRDINVLNYFKAHYNFLLRQMETDTDASFTIVDQNHRYLVDIIKEELEPYRRRKT